MSKAFIIIGESAYDEVTDTPEPVYWSNDAGWVDRVLDASVFTEEEKDMSALPRGGKWLDVTAEMGEEA
jgi:hypothetical protein